MEQTLKFLLPNGSLSERLRAYLAQAGYETDKPDRRGRCGASTDGRIEFWERDRRGIPARIADNGYDAGITGLDLLLESGTEDRLRKMASLCFAKRSDRPTRWVLAGNEDARRWMYAAGRERKAARVGCELPQLARTLLAQAPPKFQDRFQVSELVKLEGNEEMAVTEGLCDLVLVVTETGGTLRDLGLHILPDCERLLVSTPQILAKPALSPEKEEVLQELRFALEAVVGAATRVMLKFDLPRCALPGLDLPSGVSPTISPLAREGWVAVEICILRTQIGPIGLRVERAGGRAIVVQDVIAYTEGRSAEAPESAQNPIDTLAWRPEPGVGYRR